MSRQADIDRVWEIIGKVGVCMLTTRFAGGLRARPLEARPERDTGLIWFVTDLHSSKEQEIETEHDVALVFIDAKEKAYLSITACRGDARSRQGRADLEADRRRVVERSERSRCVRAARAPAHRGAMGRTSEQRGRRL
jgi:general stress protein 26